MKRRTFLQLSPVFLTLPLSLGLTGCGGSRQDSRLAPSISASSISSAAPNGTANNDTDLGMTLDEAKASSKHFFILCNNKFYPLFHQSYPYTRNREHDFQHDISTSLIIDDISYYNSFPYGSKQDDPLTDNCSLLNGDQLVYLSSGSIPDHIDFMELTASFYTIPLVFTCGDPYHSLYPDEVSALEAFPYRQFSDYDSNYVPADNITSERISVISKSDLTINGLSVQDYCATHTMVSIYHTEEQSMIDNTLKSYNYQYVVDLTQYVSLDPAKQEDGILELIEENSENVVTIGYYIGTEYYSFTLKANCLAFLHSPSASYSCPLSLTQNGYAIIDTSSLPSGDYAMGSAPDTSVKTYTCTTAYGFVCIP